VYEISVIKHAIEQIRQNRIGPSARTLAWIAGHARARNAAVSRKAAYDRPTPNGWSPSRRRNRVAQDDSPGPTPRRGRGRRSSIAPFAGIGNPAAPTCGGIELRLAAAAPGRVFQQAAASPASAAPGAFNQQIEEVAVAA